MRALGIVESAYRATLEEQDDTVVWMTHAMKGAGADLALLLKGSAVNYAATGQDASGLRFGEKPQTNPPDLVRDLTKLIDKGVEVYVVEEDVAARGLERTDLVDGIKPVSRAAVPKMFEDFDQIWHW